MSKQMTPCEKLGYKVGDMFEMTASGYGWSFGDVVKLVRDDGSICPEFEGVTAKNSRYDDNKMFIYIDDERVCVKRIRAKLKPAKQALADAIHQNGGWVCGDYMFATSNGYGDVFCSMRSPSRAGYRWVNVFESKFVCSLSGTLQNWHQTILSRDEYFTAYPEQKVEIVNETKHKVEVEMKSESEMTIKVSDWHKNGELPPVGEVCEAYIDYHRQWIKAEIVAHKDGFAIGWCKSLMKGCHGDKAYEFRPLRTERDKAIDEMVSSVLAVMNGDLQRRLREDLYDAGYRKEVK
ncbi:hypothetical protein D3C79_286980 [compost metagenome]